MAQRNYETPEQALSAVRLSLQVAENSLDNLESISEDQVSDSDKKELAEAIKRNDIVEQLTSDPANRESESYGIDFLAARNKKDLLEQRISLLLQKWRFTQQQLLNEVGVLNINFPSEKDLIVADIQLEPNKIDTENISVEGEVVSEADELLRQVNQKILLINQEITNFLQEQDVSADDVVGVNERFDELVDQLEAIQVLAIDPNSELTQEDVDRINTHVERMLSSLRNRIDRLNEKVPIEEQPDFSQFDVWKEKPEAHPQEAKIISTISTEIDEKITNGSFSFEDQLDLDLISRLNEATQNLAIVITAWKRSSNPDEVKKALYLKDEYYDKAKSLLTLLDEKKKEAEQEKIATTVADIKTKYPKIGELFDMVEAPIPQGSKGESPIQHLKTVHTLLEASRRTLLRNNFDNDYDVNGVNQVLVDLVEEADKLLVRLQDETMAFLSYLWLDINASYRGDPQQIKELKKELKKPLPTSDRAEQALDALEDAWSNVWNMQVSAPEFKLPQIVSQSGRKTLFPKDRHKDAFYQLFTEKSGNTFFNLVEKRKTELYSLYVDHLASEMLRKVDGIVFDKNGVYDRFTNRLELSELESLLGQLKSDLDILEKYFDKTTDSGSSIRTKFDKYISLFEKALEPYKEKQENEVLKQRIRKIIERKWEEIMATEATTKNNTQNIIRLSNPYKQENEENAGILPLVEAFFPEELRRWELLIDMYNGFAAGANTDIFKQFAWSDVEHSRNAAKGHVGFDQLKEFASLPEIVPIVRYMEEVFATGPYTYQGKDGKTVTHNYAKDGNPNAQQAEDGVLTVSELLAKKFPNVPNSAVSGVQLLGIIGEIRVKYFRKYYGGYLKSPDGTFDVSPIKVHSPMDAITYKIRSGGYILPDFRMLWQIMRFPIPSTKYPYVATRRSSRDGSNHSGFVDGIEPPKNNDYERYGDKYRKPLYSGSYPEALPVDDPKKKNPDGAYLNNQISDAIEVRTLQDIGLTSKDEILTPVRLGEDFTVIPYYWDIVFAKDENGKRKFGAITYEEYNLSCKFFDEFRKAAQYPEPIQKVTDVNDRIGSIVGKISPFKALLAIIPSHKGLVDSDGKPLLNDEGKKIMVPFPEGVRFRNLIKQMLLRYTKHVYDQYEQQASYPVTQRFGRALTKRDYFFDMVIEEYEKLGTLDKEIKNFMIEVLRKEKRKKFFDSFFSPAKGHVMPLINFTERRKREKLLEQYLKEPPPGDKDH